MKKSVFFSKILTLTSGDKSAQPLCICLSKVMSCDQKRKMFSHSAVHIVRSGGNQRGKRKRAAVRLSINKRENTLFSSVCPLIDVDVITISLFWKMFSVSTD